MNVLWAVYIFGFGYFVGQMRHMKDANVPTFLVGIAVGLAWPVVLVVATVARVTRPAGRNWK